MFALQCFGTGVFVCFALGGSKAWVREGLVWLFLEQMPKHESLSFSIREPLSPWMPESLSPWMLESLSPWIPEALNPWLFESLAQGVATCFLPSWKYDKHLWRKLSCIVSSVAVYAHILAQAPWAYRLRSLAIANALVAGVWSKIGPAAKRWPSCGGLALSSAAHTLPVSLAPCR